ncbi:phosphatidylinositol 3,4,5-trisphosphate 5-phosphatase 2B [Exaiptasia diaphana]|uniref:SH2 domain-containing protein n=1 Tax=Exaiptasia diaphana TaxID=2652724 RepID=A0A913XI72_EXADI|nr:phosphatidylinositol 3,4,5-trisphosphate 5-phosphatase 2B [Exaiptasia diaphana]KXJ11861.1 Phosphatidylinositol 3,4,5-trisphosphate 5-phosphatase 2B [Exaiptasia diaphana]
MIKMSGGWYHKGISSQEAFKLLPKNAKDGSFLIRDSESVPNALVLCLRFQGQVHLYRIFTREQDGRLYLQTGSSKGSSLQYFELLEQLVTYYSQPDRGLKCPLKYPIISASYYDESGIYGQCIKETFNPTKHDSSTFVTASDVPMKLGRHLEMVSKLDIPSSGYNRKLDVREFFYDFHLERKNC